MVDRDYTRARLDRKPSPPDDRDYRLTDYLHPIGATPPADPSYADKTIRQISAEGASWALLLRIWALIKELADQPPPPPPAPGGGSAVWPDAEQLDQGETGHCHPPGTLVRMADGSHKPIEDVNLFDQVVTAKGRYGIVSAVIGHQHVGDMLTIRLRGQRDGVRCTPEHPILTEDGYVAAADLQTGMKVASPRRLLVPRSSEIAMESIVPRDRWQTLTRRYHHPRGPSIQVSVAAPPETITLTRDFGKLIGLYLAEGYAHGTAVTKWAFGGHEENTLVAECCDLIRSTLQTEPRLQYRPNGVIIVDVDGRHWVDFFRTICGKGAGGKRLTLDGPRDYLEGVIDGWIAGDGYERGNTRMGVTVSRTLAYDMYGIASDLGYAPTIRSSEGKPNRGVRSRKDRYEVSWGIGGGRNRTPGWRPVVTIERSAYAGPVYNLEVEGEHSFVAQGIGVHNCVGFGCSQWGNTLPFDDHYTNEQAHALYYQVKSIELGRSIPNYLPPGSGPANVEDGANVRDGMKALQKNGRLNSYARAYNTHTEVIPWLQQHGTIVVGTEWLAGMDNYDSATGLLRAIGTSRGGHCYAVSGYVEAGDKTPDSVTFPFDVVRMQNSWGSIWNQRGYGYLSVTDMQTLLDRNGEAWAAVELPI